MGASDIILSAILRENELDVLAEQISRVGGFEYRYDAETIAYLKKSLGRDRTLAIVARRDGAFAGFVSADTDWWESGYFFLREIFVRPEFQGLGLGRKLAMECVEHARRNGACSIVTETAFENIPMRRLCESLGFARWENPQWKEGTTYKMLFD